MLPWLLDFFFNDTATTEIYTLSLHAALPILRTHISRGERRTIVGCIGDDSLLEEVALLAIPGVESITPVLKPYKLAARRSEEHTSELQSRQYALCRLLLEKKTLMPCSVRKLI